MQQKPAPTPDIFREGEINDVVVRDLRKFNDDRGWLSELFRSDESDPEFYFAFASGFCGAGLDCARSGDGDGLRAFSLHHAHHLGPGVARGTGGGR